MRIRESTAHPKRCSKDIGEESRTDGNLDSGTEIPLAAGSLFGIPFL